MATLATKAQGASAPGRGARRRLRRVARRLAFAFAVGVVVSPAILVFLWMLSLSFKNEIDNLAYPPVLIPDTPTLANYVQVFAENAMGRYFVNSVIVSGASRSGYRPGRPPSRIRSATRRLPRVSPVTVIRSVGRRIRSEPSPKRSPAMSMTPAAT